MAGRILVLDDEENYAAMLQELLRQNNYLVDMATKPELALAQLEEVPYDLVISDYKMPVMDGAGFLKRARQLYPNLPVILVSGLMNTPELVKVANMSVTLVLEKPVDTEVFLKNVARFSSPMSDAEKSANLDSAKTAARATVSSSKEPKYFSAQCSRSAKVLNTLWNCSKNSGYAYVLEPSGIDTLLALKDISAWKGSKDLPIKTMLASDFFGGGHAMAEEVLADEALSNVVIVQVSSVDELSESRLLIEQTMSKFVGGDGLFFVFTLASELATSESFLSAAGTNAVLMPALKSRPLDLAEYLIRAVRLAEKHSATPREVSLSPDAVFLALNHDWPNNYKEVMEVISNVVKPTADTIEAEGLASALKNSAEVLAPDQRFAALLQKLQAYNLQARIDESGESAAELLEKLNVPAAATNGEIDLSSISLVDDSIAAL